MFKYFILFLSLLCLPLTQVADGATTPLSINLIPPVQFPPQDFTVVIARASVLWGRHRNMYGVDVAAGGNITDGNFVGLAVAGIFNTNNGISTIFPIQLAGIGNTNINKTNIFGVQVAGAFNINRAESSVAGVQLAVVNDAFHTVIGGFQIGIYNKAKAIYGFQIGLVNIVGNLHGIQIGLLNYNNAGPFEVSPIINVGF